MGQILQEDIKILDTHAPNNRESKDMRQKLIELQRNIDESIIIVEEFSPLYQKWTDPANRIWMEIGQLKNIINQLDIIDI